MNCDYESQVINTLDNVRSEEQCQMMCSEELDCHYYLFDSVTRKCESLASSKRSCDLLMAPADTPLKDCLPTNSK